MAVKIRMTRMGARNASAFRVVAIESKAPRDGRYLENLGWYDPNRDGVTFDLKMDRIEHWRDHGAVVSESVRSLLRMARKAAAAS